MAKIADLNDILERPERQRQIVADELTEIVDKYGDVRRTQFAAWDGDMADEDFIAETDVVVTITNPATPSAPRWICTAHSDVAARGQGAQLRADDVVQHLFVTTTHNWILFFTTKGRVYRAKAYQLPRLAATPRVSTWPTCWRSSPTKPSPRSWRCEATRMRRIWCWRPATDGSRRRRCRSTTPRAPGINAINLVGDDELISAELITSDDDLICVSRKGMSVRFAADDATLRPMGRATTGWAVSARRRRRTAVHAGRPPRPVPGDSH